VRELLSVEDARARILERAERVSVEHVPVGEAAGRVLAEPALARTDLPPFPSSAMDGFALRAADAPGTLPVAFEVAAGRASRAPLPPGSAAAIATGGAVPDGADAVVPIEAVAPADGVVEVPRGVEPGAHVRSRGGDVREGDPVVAPGVRLGPAQLGALAAAGVAEVACARRPCVAVLATGSELRAPGESLEHGQIYESNRLMLAAVLEAAGAAVEQLPAVADDEQEHRDAIARGLEADALVSSGGVSVGPHDLVRGIEAELGVEEVFWGVAVKPGKPLTFGVRGRTLVFGLPGNPVSSLVGAILFVAPAVLALQGATIPGPLYQEGTTALPLRRNERRDEYVRALRRLDAGGGVVLESVGGQDSHMIVRASAADALVRVPRGEGEIPAGGAVRYVALA
jgi:molybdopterin molybdotransferase